MFVRFYCQCVPVFLYFEIAQNKKKLKIKILLPTKDYNLTYKMARLAQVY